MRVVLLCTLLALASASQGTGLSNVVKLFENMLKTSKGDMKDASKAHEDSICDLDSNIAAAKQGIADQTANMIDADNRKKQGQACNGEQRGIRVKNQKQMAQTEDDKAKANEAFEEYKADTEQQIAQFSNDIGGLNSAIEKLTEEAQKRGSGADDDKMGQEQGAARGTGKVLGTFQQMLERFQSDKDTKIKELELATKSHDAKIQKYNSMIQANQDSISAAESEENRCSGDLATAIMNLADATANKETEQKNLKDNQEQKKDELSEFENLTAKTAESDAAAQMVIGILDSDDLDSKARATKDGGPSFIQLKSRGSYPMHGIEKEFKSLINVIEEEKDADSKEKKALNNLWTETTDDKERAATDKSDAEGDIETAKAKLADAHEKKESAEQALAEANQNEENDVNVFNEYKEASAKHISDNDDILAACKKALGVVLAVGDLTDDWVCAESDCEFGTRMQKVTQKGQVIVRLGPENNYSKKLNYKLTMGANGRELKAENGGQDMKLSKDGSTLTIAGKDWKRKGAADVGKDNSNLSGGSQEAIKALQELEKDTTSAINTEKDNNEQKTAARAQGQSDYEAEKATQEETIRTQSEAIANQNEELDGAEARHGTASNNHATATGTLKANKRDHTWWKENGDKRASQQDDEISGYESVIGVIQGTKAYEKETADMGAAKAQAEADYQSGKTSSV